MTGRILLSPALEREARAEGDIAYMFAMLDAEYRQRVRSEAAAQEAAAMETYLDFLAARPRYQEEQ